MPMNDSSFSSKPLSEYPTPQFQRDSYFSLNGEWEFEINKEPSFKGPYEKRINVPYAVETKLSKVEKRVKKGEWLHYKKIFDLPEGINGERILLHFEAVDQICDVYLNDVKICHHEGGYLPFTVDCLEIKEKGNELRVDVYDDPEDDVFPRGKQSSKPHGIWYTPTSGIWGSVWMEAVPKQVIQSLKITPDFDNKILNLGVRFEGKIETSEIIVKLRGKEIWRGPLNEQGQANIDLSHSFVAWRPSSPELYDLTVKVNKDEIHSYFAMRKISIIEKDGHLRVALNNEPLFISGLLDQGYYEESGLTPPSDEAMVKDILFAKNLGFNCLRKHIKIEPMRWYYHCDRLGMLVMQDFVNGGSSYNPLLIALAPFFGFKTKDGEPYAKLGRKSPKSRIFFEKEMPFAVERLYNSPCIFAYTLFNEGWGQFDSSRLTEELRKLDPTRLIDSTSGWFDQGAGDFSSHHIYFKKVRMKEDGRRILSLSEFGGYSLRIKGHCFSKKNFGYKRMKDQKTLNDKLRKLYEKEIIPLIPKGLSMAILTQLSDVEEETNGLITYDRKIKKADTSMFIDLHRRMSL